MTKTFLLSWDCHGLEACLDITQDLELGQQREQSILLDILREPEVEHLNEHSHRINIIVRNMVLRAQVNSQRQYEIYLINTEDDLDTQALKESFNIELVKLIRDRGTRLFGGYSEIKKDFRINE
jgi:hypothetical protein